MYKSLLRLLILTLFVACSDNELPLSQPVPDPLPTTFIKAVDISGYPEIAATGPVFYDLDGNEKEMLVILKDKGVNTIRLRLWVNPENEHSGMEEVRSFARQLQSMDFKIWLSVHYSDTWADPGQQAIPIEWQNDDIDQLKERVVTYTAMVVEEIRPDYIQIGNEINAGFLFPFGNLSQHPDQFRELLAAASAAVRITDDNTKIIIHFAGLEGADWFFNQIPTLDYDIIGLSYYPIWHGKSLDVLKNTMERLDNDFDKDILIAETAYPFTLGWNDWTNNIVGLEEQLILPEYPATPIGQRDFIRSIKSISEEIGRGNGFCYWGGELIAWKGEEAEDASPWENQALFDFQNRGGVVLEVFGEE